MGHATPRRTPTPLLSPSSEVSEFLGLRLSADRLHMQGSRLYPDDYIRCHLQIVYSGFRLANSRMTRTTRDGLAGSTSMRTCSRRPSSPPAIL
jgi:hypothetical protein